MTGEGPAADASDPTELAGVAEMHTEAVEAWSLAALGEPPRRSWRSVWLIAAGIVAVPAIGAAGVMAVRHHQGQTSAPPPPSVASTSSVAPTGPRGSIDGKYQLVFNDSAEHSKGQAPPSFDGTEVEPWAFWSSCSADVCTARAVALQQDDELQPHPRIISLTFVSDYWLQTDPSRFLSRYGCEMADTWELHPRSDGTFEGVETDTFEGGDACRHPVGSSWITPFVATRVGPIPPTVHATLAALNAK